MGELEQQARAARALVVDDEPIVRDTAGKLLRTIDAETVCAANADEALEALGQDSFDIVFLDIHLGGGPDGLATLERIRRMDASLPVVIITGDTSSQRVIDSMKKGAYEYLQKPFTARQFCDLASQALDARRRSREAEGTMSPAAEEPDSSEDGAFIVGNSPSMIALFKQIGLASRSDAPVLITGESGCGKELTARSVHDNSARANHLFLSLNCAAIPEGLIESELFGHEKGSFTGAHQRQPGKFEQCGKGTILLDEIGDMPLAAQAKLLRVLQDGEYQRVGGSALLKSEARVIAATNRDLEERIREGRFRLDLYYRLNVINLRIPSLRERPGDIEPLVEHFIRKHRGLSAQGVEGVEQAALRALEGLPWPGNARQLEGAIRKAIVFSRSKTLLADDFNFLFEGGAGGGLEPDPREENGACAGVPARAGGAVSLEELVDRLVDRLAADPASDGEIYRGVMDRVEERVLVRAMNICKSNQSLTAKRLGISRNNLRAKLKQYDAI